MNHLLCFGWEDGGARDGGGEYGGVLGGTLLFTNTSFLPNTSLHLNPRSGCEVVDYTISMGKARSTKFPVTKGHIQFSVAFEFEPRM